MVLTLLIILVLVVLSFFLRTVLGGDWAGLMLAIVSIGITLMYQQLRELSVQCDKVWARKWSWNRITTVARRLAPILTYSDFSVLIISAFLLNVALFNSFVTSIEDLRDKGFIAFPKG